MKTRVASTLSWSSTNATSCTASGSWSGAQASNGSLTVQSAVTGSFPYVLTCTNAEGTASATATLMVTARTAADYYQVEDTGVVIRNDNPDTARALNSAESLDLNGDGVMDALINGPEFANGDSNPNFRQQSLHVLLGGPRVTVGDALFPGGRPTFTVSNYTVSFDFNDDGRRDVFVPEFGADKEPFGGGQSGAWLSGNGVFSPATVDAAMVAMHGASAGRVAGKNVVFAHAVCCGAEQPAFLYVFEAGRFRIDRSLLPSLVTEAVTPFPSYRLWLASAITDLDQDGIDDLVLGNFAAGTQGNDPKRGNYVVFGRPEGWQNGEIVRLPDPQGIEMANYTPPSLTTADFNGDGRRDIVINYTERYRTRGIQILQNTGSRTFMDVSTAMLGAQAYVQGNPGSTLPALDLNGDGCVDLVEPELSSFDPQRRGRILLNDCRGQFVVANEALAGVLSSVPVNNMLPFFDHTGRVSFYLPERVFAPAGGFESIRYKKLTNLTNLPTPVDGRIVFD